MAFGPITLSPQKPQNKIRIPTSQAVRLGLFSGVVWSSGFLYRGRLFSSSQSRRAVFAFKTRYTFRREQSRITRWPSFCFGLSEIPNAHDCRSSTRHAQAMLMRSTDATDHTITSPQPQRRLQIISHHRGCTGTQKLPVSVFFFVCFGSAFLLTAWIDGSWNGLMGYQEDFSDEARCSLEI